MRLIHGVSASHEAEASMIWKLRVACGFEYMHKLQRMFTGARQWQMPQLTLNASRHES